MRKMIIIKKIMSLFIVLFLSTNTFAAVVSDNDGAAFITKAEFDSLKNNFQAQLNSYNAYIDNKIDSAIASYLEGATSGKINKMYLDSSTNYSYPLVLMSNSTAWNNTKSDYYNVARNRVRFQQYTIVDFFEDYNQEHNSILIDSDTDTTIFTVPVGNLNTYLCYGFLNKKIREVKGKNGELYVVTQSSSTRRVGSTNYKVFDIGEYGSGYQFVDYQIEYTTTRGRNAGHFGPSHNGYFTYCAVLMTNGGYDNVKPAYNGNVNNWKGQWTDARFVSSGSGWSNRTFYMGRSPSYVGTKVKISAIGEWNLHGSAGVEFTNKPIDSSSFVWDKTNKKSMVYAGTSTVPAQRTAKFAYEGNFQENLDTLVECIDIQEAGYTNGWVYNPSSSNRTTGRFFAWDCTYIPPLLAVNYDGYNSTVPSFGALPATCMRYYDSKGNEHFLDEGMFLCNFDKKGTVNFDVRFTAKSGTKNLNFYVSKYPFSRANLKTRLTQFKVNNSTSTYTSRTLATGTTYHITVDDINVGEQLYLLWEPSSASDWVALSDFSNFTLTSKS